MSGVDVAVDDGSTTDGAHGAETFAAALRQGKSDAHGWVFLDGVRPGNVHLHARPVERLPQTTETYAVQAGEEITLDPIVLAAPARITVRVDAGRELFDEGLKLLGVQLTAEKVAARRLEPLRENISAANSVRFPPVLPGSWRVAVVGRLPGTTAMEFASTTVTLHEGEEAMVELPVRHRVYHGRFTGISESLDSAVLVLRPLEKGPAFTLRLDASGRFGVPLEAAAEYSAALDLKDHSQAFEIDSIRFTDPAEELEIPLPSAEVRGMVVETNGRPVAGATIVAEVGELNASPTERPRSTRARSREDGSFVFSYAESGRWTLAAETAGLASDRVNVAVGDGRRISGLTLTMAPKITIQGAVEGSPETLRRGLSVTFWPVSGIPGEPSAPKVASTDATGRFEFLVMSRGIAMGDFVVESRDGLVAAVRSAIPSKAPVMVRLPASTGGMRFERSSGSPWPRFASTLQRLIAPDGAQVPFYAVSRSASDTVRIIPALAPGTWRFAEAVTPDEMFRLMHGMTEGLITATFEIIPGREGRIEIRTR
ncbi:MAG TPA: carboxypeptidase-like regulatory domain-containing protein [Thermoanaerobaculia bacterium]|nr:carboxypeptidase-like regulatory domain-containing protein [Thermoanaerobaculia bacterium]